MCTEKLQLKPKLTGFLAVVFCWFSSATLVVASDQPPNVIIIFVGGNANVSSAIQASLPMCGQTDFLSERNRKISAEKEIWQKFLGGSQEEQPETYRLASPLVHLDKMDPPCWIITGQLDDPSTHADKFRKRLDELEIETGMTLIEDAPHGFLNKQVWFDEAMETADKFFTKTLK